MASLQPPPSRRLALGLGLLTFLPTTVVRFYWEFTGDLLVVEPLGLTASGLVLRGAAVLTLVAIGWLAVAGRRLREAAVVLVGSMVGVGAFLVFHWAVFGPSTDSPTWLIYLVACGMLSVAGGLVYALGLTARRFRNSRTAKPRL